MIFLIETLGSLTGSAIGVILFYTIQKTRKL